MSDFRRDADFLLDILEAIQRIMEYTGEFEWEIFISDYKTQDAVVRNLEIIGEAVKNISENLRLKYPKIPWREMAATRDRLTHHYFGVNQEIVWQIVQDDLPELLTQINHLLSELS